MNFKQALIGMPVSNSYFCIKYTSEQIGKERKNLYRWAPWNGWISYSP